jgi:Ca2+-binding RTX toxin-like protein
MAFVSLVEVASIEVGLGNDIVHGTGNRDTILGGAGDDTIYGYAGNDVIRGEGGVDVLDGGLGNDTLEGGDGDDSLYGRAGNDLLVGAAGADLVEGGDGDDILDGGAGTDNVAGGGGNDNFRVRGDEAVSDTMLGGAGSDRITNYVDNPLTLLADLQFQRFVGADQLIEFINAGGKSIIGTAGDNLLDFRLIKTNAPSSTVTFISVLSVDGGAGDDEIHGTRGNDTLLGGTGVDRLFGYAGNDLLDGGEGNDTLIGHEGTDTLVGGDGADTLAGGAGTDSFRFQQSILDLAELDLVQDYLDDTLVFAGYAPGPYASWTFPVGDKILTVSPTSKRVRLVGAKTKPAANRVIIQN